MWVLAGVTLVQAVIIVGLRGDLEEARCRPRAEESPGWPSDQAIFSRGWERPSPTFVPGSRTPEYRVMTIARDGATHRSLSYEFRLADGKLLARITKDSIVLAGDYRPDPKTAQLWNDFQRCVAIDSIANVAP